LTLFGVPDAPRYRLRQAPLAQALAQVRFPLLATLETMHGIRPLQEELRAEFPYMEQERVQEVALVVGPAGPAGGMASSESVTWKLANDAGTMIVIGAGSATLSAGTSYTTIEDFSRDFQRMLTALDSVDIARCDRFGARYLSLATNLPGEDRSWRRWFRPDLLGWAGSSFIADYALENAVNQVTLGYTPETKSGPLPTKIQATVRHGALPANTDLPGIPPLHVSEPSYFLDLDVYSLGYQSFDPKAILEQFMIFHQQIDRFFYWSLSEEGREHFGITNHG